MFSTAMPFFWIVIFSSATWAAHAQQLPAKGPALQWLDISNTGTFSAALPCPIPLPSAARPPTAMTTKIPSDADVARALQAGPLARTGQPPRSAPLRPSQARIAIWGDSHMAAAFFSEEWVRQLQPASVPLSSRFIHPGVGHGGVRALVRKSCFSGPWAREMAYANADAAAAPGPGMISLVAKGPGATLALDLRDAQGRAQQRVLQVLYHGKAMGTDAASADGTRLAISVDGENEVLVTLAGQAGPQALTLQARAAMSTLQIRVVSGAFRLQGIELTPTSAPGGLHIDLFAYPGATMAGWANSNMAYLSTWFAKQDYDMAVFAFGTNEANDPRFSLTQYRDMLDRALGNFRQVFPQTQCVLIGPGDRGVRVPLASADSTQAKPKPGQELLHFSRIHQQIGQVQAQMATQHGCLAWHMQTAMGGAGSAYAWARNNPALMAPDLIHFTPAGYRELANTFLRDFGVEKTP